MKTLQTLLMHDLRLQWRYGIKPRSDAAQARKDTEERVTWLMKEWEELSVRLAAVSEDA